MTKPDVSENKVKTSAIVLVVEDNEGLNHLIQKRLKEKGFEVEGVLNGAGAIAKANDSCDTVLLLDYKLPDMTGKHVIETLARRNRSVPFIIMSGKGDEKIAVEMMKMGARDYIVKDTGLLDILPHVIDRVVKELKKEKELADAEKTLKEALVKEHEKLNKLFMQVENAKKEWEGTMDCVGDMVILSDESGKIKRCNKTFTEFTGLSYQTIINKDWIELLHEQGIEVNTFYGKSIELFQNSTGRWFQLNTYPLDDSKLNLKGNVITIHDNTEIKVITGELEQKNKELENAYEELKNTQTRILQQEKMASIGQLAAGVAHEINNPMGFISSNLGTLGKYLNKLTEFINIQSEAVESLKSAEVIKGLKEKRKQLKLDYILEDVEELIKESLDGAERVKRIVQNLKSFSRVDEAEYKPADINECIESTLNIVWNELKYKAAVEKEYGEIPLTKCYPQQLNQVFMNLLVNAAQAIEKQGEIKIKTWNGDNFINVSISDTGGGIPEDKVNRIFEPFFTTKEVGKGTGLGLSIAYDIVKKHNGEISVESEVGRGSTFTVRIPVVEG